MHLTNRLLPFVLFGAVSALAQNTLVVPNGDTAVPGNAPQALPNAPTSIELQELLGSGQFATAPITITAISLRASAGAGPVSETISSLTLTLSTSPNFPNTNGTGKTLMSTTFANNVGPDKTVVYSGSVAAKDSGCAAPGPCPFDITLTLQEPFVYDATKGQLLLDFMETNLSGSGALDGVSFSAPGGSVADVVGASGSATGTFTYGGPIVQLTYTTSAPIITGVVNVSSNIPPGMPNYGIAQGSLFAVYGSQMGPANLTVATLPLPTTGLSGTSITISGTGTTVSAPIYFARADIVVAVMPSNTPTGNGTITVTYNGEVGNSPITITQSAFGISNNLIPYANNSIGVFNRASVTLGYQSITPTNTAKPGDTLTVWGTGLGASPNGDDTNLTPGGNIGPAPLVFVGGVQSPSVTYWGRSPGTFPGLDQVNFVVPQGAPLGCNVSVIVQTTNGATPIVSNAPTIALAATDGATCSDPTQVITPADLGLNSAKALVAQVRQDINITGNAGGPPSGTISGRAEVDLVQLTQPQIVAQAPSQNVAPSFGSCQVGINANPSANGPVNFTFLNAGSTISLTPPSGSVANLTDQASGTPGVYSADLGTVALGQPNPTFTLPSGTWSFSDGTGGPDIGPSNFNFPVPQPIGWANRGSLISSNVTRSSPLTILWSGGDSLGYVDIQGFTMAVGAAGSYYVSFECAAPESAGQFTIPSSILLSLPALSGFLEVNTYALPNTLGKVPGFDVSVANSQFNTQIPVTYK